MDYKEIISNYKEELELLETLEFKSLNKEQKQMLKDKYNYYTGGFDYAVDDWGSIVLVCGIDAHRNMEHYLGLEYERDYIEFKMSDARKTIVVYSGSDRLEKVLKNLQELE